MLHENEDLTNHHPYPYYLISYSLKLLGLQPLNPKDLEPKLAAINANELNLKKFGS